MNANSTELHHYLKNLWDCDKLIKACLSFIVTIPYLKCMLVILLCDTILGIIKACMSRDFSMKAMFQGIKKIAIYFVLIILSHTIAMSFNIAIIDNFSMGLIIITEFAGCIEKLSWVSMKTGVKIPFLQVFSQFFKECQEDMKDKEKEKIENERKLG